MSRPRTKSVWREYAEAIVISLLLALFIRTFIVQAFKIPSGSMIPTLLVGDHLLVNKFLYRFRDPHRGDVVVFKFPQDRKTDFIKRIMAVAGDKIEVRDKQVYVNGRPVDEPFAYYVSDRQGTDLIIANHAGRTYRYPDPAAVRETQERSISFGPVEVPPGKVFVMGDNRDNSFDSRFWGPVDRKDVVGKAMIIYWSWGGSLLDKGRWKRIGNLIR